MYFHIVYGGGRIRYGGAGRNSLVREDPIDNKNNLYGWMTT